jgi:hypothetical protein
MENVIKDAFLVLMFAIIAALAYVLFFGMWNMNGDKVQGVDGYWKGALFYASDAVQTGISKYYYNYCYLPSYNVDAYVDDALGLVDSNRYDTDKVETDLTKNDNESASSGSTSYLQNWE